jgi:hypothetical protein
MCPKTSLFFFFDCVIVDPFVITSFSQNVEFVILVVDPTRIKADLAYNKEKTKCIRGIVVSKTRGLQSYLQQILL